MFNTYKKFIQFNGKKKKKEKEKKDPKTTYVVN